MFRTSIIFLIFTASLNAFPSSEAAADTLRRKSVYEAEEARYDRLTEWTDSTASGGAYLKIGYAGGMTWLVKTDTSGWFECVFRYRSPEGEKEQSFIRNGVERKIGFGWSVDWNSLAVPTCLQKGMNTIGLKAGWGKIDVDCLTLNPIHPKPSVTPRQDFFYKNFPRDVCLNLNLFGRRVDQILCGKREIPFSTSDFPFQEDALSLTLSSKAVFRIPDGKQTLVLRLDDGDSLRYGLRLAKKRKPSRLTIIAPDVEHGSSVLFILPTKRTLLVDCGKASARDGVIIPFLARHLIRRIDTFVITHYHEDHDGGDGGRTIIKKYRVRNFYDYRSFTTGRTIDLEGVKLKILNGFWDGADENTRSLCFRLEYNGFVYVHGGDVYAENQRKIMERFPGDVRADVYFANHHFHGSVDVDYLRAVRPSVVLLQAQEAVYARSAYMVDFKKNVEPFLSAQTGGPMEVLPSIEVGTVVIRVNGKDDWTYETYRDTKNAIIPFLK
jgi:beta-lactamase superfamily II metal-dependent hydrolase